MSAISDALTQERPELSPLSSAMQRLRLKILKSVKDATLDDAMALLRGRLPQEADETTRLGYLAAQTWIVRQKFALIGAAAPATVDDQLAMLDPARKKLVKAPPAEAAPDDMPGEQDPAVVATQGWQKVKILEETVVNGMRFFRDSVIEVNPDDAQKLVASEKAVIFTEPKPETPATKAKAKKKPAAKAKKPAAEQTEGGNDAAPETADQPEKDAE